MTYRSRKMAAHWLTLGPWPGVKTDDSRGVLPTSRATEVVMSLRATRNIIIIIRGHFLSAGISISGVVCVCVYKCWMVELEEHLITSV